MESFSLRLCGRRKRAELRKTIVTIRFHELKNRLENDLSITVSPTLKHPLLCGLFDFTWMLIY